MRALTVLREVHAARRAQREVDAIVATHLEQNPSACRAGCSYCCHVHVDATRGEVRAIAEHVGPSILPELREHVRRVATMSDDERWRARVPCFFLREGRCSIYEVRPVRCRAFHSFNVEACRDAFSGGDPPLPIDEVLERACDDVDLDGEHVTLESALLEVLR